jgi:hypothetical protein
MIDTLLWIKYEETRKLTHIYPASAESQILRYFKMRYISILPIFTARFRSYQNGVSHREELLRD